MTRSDGRLLKMAIYAVSNTEKLTATVSIPRPWSVSAWCRVGIASGIHSCLSISESSVDSAPQVLIGNVQASFFGSRLTDDGAGNWNGSNYPITGGDIGSWAFICVSNDVAGNIVSGIAFTSTAVGFWDNSGSLTATASNTLTHLTIGDDPAADGFFGGVEEVRIWTRALTIGEFASERSYPWGPLSSRNLYAYYPLLDSSNYLKDATGNGHDLSVASGRFGFTPGIVARDPIIRWRTV